MEPNAIYHEKFAAKGFIAILSPIAAMMFIILLYHLFIESAEPFLFWTLFFSAMFFAFFFLTINFAALSITMTDETITVGFGIIKHRVLLKDVVNCAPDEVSSMKYGGFGIRVAKVKGKKRLVYNTIGTPAASFHLRRENSTSSPSQQRTRKR